MTVQEVSAKIDIRLNKQATADYDNLWAFNKGEAFNKAVIEWVRKQKHGKNQTQEGDEETDVRVDDLQVLLKTEDLTVRDKGLFAQSSKIPPDYLFFKRLTPSVSKGSCANVTITSYLKEEANVDILVKTLPSWEFEETFHTMIGNRAHIYHNKQFSVTGATLTYYKKPKKYDFKRLNDVIEFNDGICEILVDEACKIIASDLESLNQKNLAQERAEGNN